MKFRKTRLAPDDLATYEKLGLLKDKVLFEEDGRRTSGDRGSYEWWYVDAEFEDGTTIVNVFWTKDGFDVHGAAHPRSDIEITLSDGEKISHRTYESKGKIISARKDICDLRIGKSSLKFHKGKYYLEYHCENIKYSVVMENTLPPWRQNTGYNFYDKEDKNYGAWLVPQPASKVVGTLEINGEVKVLKGTGYHDHNWGNISTNKVLDHWYWGRAQVGPYTVIACDIILSKKYGSLRLPRIMIAKDGVILEDDINKTEIQREATDYHPETKKFMDDIIRYTQKVSDDEKYIITFRREKDILVENLLVHFSKSVQFLGKLTGANPTYVRILGRVTLEHVVGETSEFFEANGLWEQMALGHSKHAIIHSY